jgi:cell division protein FtsZ
MGILTVAVVTKPFPFEGRKRTQIAEAGIAELSQHVDSLITIPNEKLLSVLGKGTTLLDAFKAANDILLGAVQGIAELITRPGLINVDFADVRTVMSEMGMAMMGSGCARGEDRARVAAEKALASPLLEDINLSGARGILVNVTAGFSMSIGEFEEVGNTVKEFASDDATVVVGTVIDEAMGDELRVTVVATGLGQSGVQLDRLDAGAVAVIEKNISLVHKNSDGDVDYGRLDRPTVIRNQMTAEQRLHREDGDMDYLDVPAFLRRQAD